VNRLVVVPFMGDHQLVLRVVENST
jgi:hypothetical protein